MFNVRHPAITALGQIGQITHGKAQKTKVASIEPVKSGENVPEVFDLVSTQMSTAPKQGIIPMSSESCMDGSLREQIRKDLEGMSLIPNLTVAHFLALPDALRHLLRWIIMNRAVTCEELASYLGEAEEEARTLVDRLTGLQLIERLPICGMPRYWVCLSPRRLRPPPELLDASCRRPRE